MKTSSFFLATLVSIAGLLPAHADVTMVSAIRSGGFKGMGGYEGASTHAVKSDRSRDESVMKFTGGVMKIVAGKERERIEILRLDLDKRWGINAKKKTYTENPITLEPVETKSERPAASNDAGEEKKPTHRISKTEFDVKKTGEKKTINGFATERNIVAMMIEVEEVATGEKTSYHLNTDVWSAAWTKTLKQASEEQQKFAQAYMKKLNLKISTEDRKIFDPRAIGMLLGVGSEKTEAAMKNFRDKMGTINGYPIVVESVWTVKEDPKAVARRDDARAQAAGDDKQDAPDLTDSPQNIAGNLLGGFAKKKMKERQAKADKERDAQPLLSTYMEIKSVDVKKIPSESFEVPAGFKKVKN